MILPTADEPLRLFAAWMDEAVASEPRDPNAMALATVDTDGLPDVRMVLLKGFDAQGFVFYTNTDSQKGRELKAQPKAALLFYWKSLNRQVRVRGPVETVTDAEADAYFATRPRGAQIGAWASKQSSRSKAGWPSRRRSRSTPRNSRSAPCRARRIGRAFASCRWRSNSGTTGRSACMTASNSGASERARRGPRRGLSDKC